LKKILKFYLLKKLVLTSKKISDFAPVIYNTFINSSHTFVYNTNFDLKFYITVTLIKQYSIKFYITYSHDPHCSLVLKFDLICVGSQSLQFLITKIIIKLILLKIRVRMTEFQIYEWKRITACGAFGYYKYHTSLTQFSQTQIHTQFSQTQIQQTSNFFKMLPDLNYYPDEENYTAEQPSGSNFLTGIFPNHNQTNSYQTYDQTNSYQTYDQTNFNQIYDQTNFYPTYDRTNSYQTYDQTNSYPTYD
jgi:hypothetical protein